MKQPSRLITFFMKPLHQAGLIAALTIVLTLGDHFMPHDDAFFKVNAGPWIVSTAMILLFIILNTIVALLIGPVIRYWGQSIMMFFVVMAFAYAWSFLLSGKHIDDVGSFRWIWIVLFMVYLVFFGIARSMKNIVDFAIKQDNKLRGEE